MIFRLKMNKVLTKYEIIIVKRCYRTWQVTCQIL